MRHLRSSRPDPPGGKLFKPRPRTRHGLEQCWVYLPREIIFGGEDDARFTPRRFILSGTKPVTLSGAIARRHRTARKHRCALRRASLTLGILRMLIHPRIAIVGDSAGSGITLTMLANLSNRRGVAAAAPFSPRKDLMLGGRSVKEKAHSDVLLDPARLADAAKGQVGALFR